ncbi:hypothetical protein [Nocardia mangyaensis]|uniref:hypothetical protein n=1 Tax=Nocardia mangyaensis TaxID=2213200 RepID=UPI002674D84C|nr:hypothetical protein [Nocardia mangyaensis]MDO3648669.1 hypothetical protein [Nocardia mangyaensis]
MSAAAESTMPATAVVEHDQAALAPVIALHPMRQPEIGTEPTELSDQLGELRARVSELEQRLADLHDRNRELASDLDDALDQLSGHALHDHQERLVHMPVNAFSAIEWEGHDR